MMVDRPCPIQFSMLCTAQDLEAGSSTIFVVFRWFLYQLKDEVLAADYPGYPI